MSEKPKITARLTDDQYRLARHRLFVEDLTWQELISTLVNAYICGDISVTKQGRYHVAPPSGDEPVVLVPSGADVVEIEPDWGVDHPRPQVGAERPRQQPRGVRAWGTTALANHLREVTGRRISKNVLRKLLKLLDIPKQDNGRWEFPGPDSEYVKKLEVAMNDGTYDTLIREGTKEANQLQRQKKKEEAEIEWAFEQDAKQRRLERLKQLRSIEEGVTT